jgi:hypothetical protein
MRHEMADGSIAEADLSIREVGLYQRALDLWMTDAAPQAFDELLSAYPIARKGFLKTGRRLSAMELDALPLHRAIRDLQTRSGPGRVIPLKISSS